MSSLIKHDNVQIGDAYALEVKPFFAKKAVKNNPVAQQQEPSAALEQNLLEMEKSITDAEAQAQKIVADAKAEAQVLKVSAADEIEALRQQAFEEAYQQGNIQGYEDGYGKGFDAGYDEAYRENHDAAVKLQQILAEFEAQRQNLLNRQAKEMKDLAFEIAGKVIDREIADDHGFYLRMINKMLDTFRSYQWVDIYIDNQPGLAVYLETHLAEEMAKASKYMRIRTREDMPLGYCMVETDAGVVDASVDTQMKQIGDLLETGGEAEVGDVGRL